MGSREEDLAELREALGGLRREIRTRLAATRAPEVRPEPSVAEPAGLDPGLGAWVRWLSTLGMREHSGEIDEFGMDESALGALRPLLDFLYDRWWGVRAGGVGHVPADGACLLVANHSGILPYDAWMIGHALERAEPARERMRFTVTDWLASLPFAAPRLARIGGVRACPENVERLLAAGRRVAVFPEGERGGTKLYRDRYRLQRFGRGGVVRVALASGAPLVPVGVVGAEEVHPILHKAVAPARPLGLPFVPLTPTFPWLGPLGALPLPARWVIRFGEPIVWDDLPPDAERDDLLLTRLTEQLRERIQQLVEEGLRERAGLA